MEPTTRNTDIILSYFQAINNQNYQNITRLVHKDYRSETRSLLSFQRALSLSQAGYSNDHKSKGPDPLINRLKFLFEGMENLSIVVKRLISKSSEIWVDFDVKGKHTGNLLGISATQKNIAYRAIGIFLIKENQIISSDILFDWFSLFYQLRGYVGSEKDVIEEYLLTLNKLGLFLEK